MRPLQSLFSGVHLGELSPLTAAVVAITLDSTAHSIPFLFAFFIPLTPMCAVCVRFVYALRVCVCMADVLSPVAFTYAGGHDIVRAPTDKQGLGLVCSPRALCLCSLCVFVFAWLMCFLP